MKKSVLTIAICLLAFAGYGQGFVESTGSLSSDPNEDLFINSDNGLGLNRFGWSGSTVGRPLHIFGESNASTGNTDHPAMRFDFWRLDEESMVDDRHKIDIYSDGNLRFLYELNGGGQTEFLRLLNNGNIGVYGDIFSEVYDARLSFGPGDQLGLKAGQFANSQFLITSDGEFDFGHISTKTSDPSLVRIYGDLKTTGKIYANEVEVLPVVPVPDYVFESDYDLMPISDLKDFIKTNKHLPGVPSAKELEGSSYNIAEMDNILLRKIEELTLHIIELEEKLAE